MICFIKLALHNIVNMFLRLALYCLVDVFYSVMGKSQSRFDLNREFGLSEIRV